MKKLLLAATLAAATCALAGTPAEEQLLKDLPGIFEKSGAHYRALLEAMKAHEPDTFPKRFQDGKLVVIKPRDWCSGFFPGSLWYLYEYTKDDFWKEQAVAYTERLIEPLRHDASNHDVGFRTYCSAGNGLRLTGDKRYAEFLHDTSAALRTRFDDNLGLIRSWNSPKKGGGHFGTKYIVIIDNMMNLELLEWDAKNGGDPKSDKSRAARPTSRTRTTTVRTAAPTTSSTTIPSPAACAPTTRARAATWRAPGRADTPGASTASR